MKRRRICYVTGTRAEFGLMRSTLDAIRSHPALELQLVVTGMHLSRSHGRTIKQIISDGWRIDATVPWPSATLASSTGSAIRGIAGCLGTLNPDVVLVTGDRVEAFAAATAGHLDEKFVAHVHGGDRAMGQVDDALRHAISKLAHLHLAATKSSGDRLFKLGEQRSRIRVVGTPGVDGIRRSAAPWWEVSAVAPQLRRREFGLIVYHPESADEAVEERRASMLVAAAEAAGVRQGIVVASNNDPGWRGIHRAWAALDATSWRVVTDLNRPLFLGALRDTAVLIGNSSSGIIEAATMGAYVINV
ncbi:MAG TPA: UDP-N-acetylglucosamine 2-epimerase, partial [Tepidisphaeraceae bacterium]